MRIPVSVIQDVPDPQEVTEEEDATWFWTSLYEAGGELPDLSIYEPWERKLAQAIFAGRGYDDAFERLHPRDRHGRFHSSWLTGGLIGISPSRSASPVLSEVVERFDSAEYQGFEQTVSRVTHRPEFNFESIRARRTIGFWEGDMEPSATIVFEGDVRHAERVAKELGGRYDQDAVALFAYDEEALGARYLIHTDDVAAAIERTSGIGFTGASFLDDAVILYDMDGSQFDQAIELAKLLQSRVDVAAGWVRFLEKGVDYEDDGADSGADQESRGGRGDRDGHDQAEANGRDHAPAGRPQEVAFEEWTPQQASLHPRDKHGRFRKKGGAVLDFAKKLLDGKKRAKELAKNADVTVGSEVAGLAVVGDALDWRKTQGLRAQRTGLIEANARKMIASDPVTRKLLTDPNVRTDYTAVWVQDTDVEGIPIRMDVDTHLQKPEGWEYARGEAGTEYFYDPEAVYTEPIYGGDALASNPLGVSGREVNIRVRSQFDPTRTEPLLEREMVGGEAADYMDATVGKPAGGGTMYVAFSEADFEALRRGESVKLDKGDKPGQTIETLGPWLTTQWTQVASQLDYMPIETRPRPEPFKGSGLGSTGYVVAVDVSGGRDLPEVTAADVRAVVTARPVAIDTVANHPIDLDVDPDAPFGTAKKPPSTNYTQLWVHKPVTDLGDEFPNLATARGGRGGQALFATRMLNRERRARADIFANEKAVSHHGAMKDEAMVALADRIDLKDQDVSAFKGLADIILSTEEAPHGSTPEQKLASSVIQSWARSSSDEHTWGHYMQYAAAREFGLPLNDWVGGPEFKRQAPGMWAAYQVLVDPIQDTDEQRGELDEMLYLGTGFGFGGNFGPDIAKMPKSDIESAERGARKVLRAMYESSQRDLDALGQPEFLLWRGLRRVQETREVGTIDLGTPETVSASKMPSGIHYEVSMRRAATADEAAMYTGSLMSGGASAMPVPLDPKDKAVGFYWPPWADTTSATAAEAAEITGFPIGEYGMIDRRVPIGRFQARELADLGDSIFEVSDSPVEFGTSPTGLSSKTGANLRIAPLKSKADEAAARAAEARGEKVYAVPKVVRIGYDEGKFIEAMRFWGRQTSDVPTMADKAESELLDKNRGATKAEKWQIHETRMQALKDLEYAGWDVGSADEATAKIETALADPDKVIPYMRDRGMLGSITIKNTITPGWLQGGLHVSDDVRANPMSSHATSQGVASNFAGEGGARIAAIVAKEDIIGMPGAGYGCLEEDEVVVLGKPRRYVVVPFGTPTPDDREVVDLIETGKVTIAPDVPQEVHELGDSTSAVPAKFLEKPEIDAFVWSYHSVKDDSTVTVDLLPLAYWIDEQTKAAVAKGDGLSLLVYPGNVVRNDATGETVHFTPSGYDYELTAQDLRDALKRAWEGADANQMASGWDAVDVKEMSGPAPGTYEPDPDIAWNNVVSLVASDLGISDGNAATLSAVLTQGLENDPHVHFTLEQAGPPAIIVNDTTGEKYEFMGDMFIGSQVLLDTAVVDVNSFFVPEQDVLPWEKETPFSPIPQDPPDLDPNEPDFSSGALAKNWLLSLPKGVGVLTPDDIGKAMRVYLESKGAMADDPHVEAATSIFLLINEIGKDVGIANITYNRGLHPNDHASFTVTFDDGPPYFGASKTISLPQMVGDNLDDQAWWLLLYRLADVIPNLLPPEAYGPEPTPGEIYLAETDAPYIFIDGPENADWPKATWDFWGVDSAAELDAYLAREHETPEHFMSLPAFYLNLDEKPAWLKLWAQQHPGRAFADWAPSAHPRWPSGDKRGGEFRPKVGDVVKGIARAVSGPSGGAQIRNAEITSSYVSTGIPIVEIVPTRMEDRLSGKTYLVYEFASDGGVSNPTSYVWGRGTVIKKDGTLGVASSNSISPVGGVPQNVLAELARVSEQGNVASSESVDPDLLKDIDDILDDLGLPPAPDEEEEVDVPEVPTVSTAAAEAMKFLTKPKLKLPGAAARSRELEVWKEVADERKPFYNTAAIQVGGALTDLTQDLQPGEYLYVSGKIRQPMEGRNANTMGYVWLPATQEWTFADNVRWRPIGGSGTGQGYELWGQTGATLSDRPVDKTGSFGRGEKASKIAELLTGAFMSESDTVRIFTPEEAGKTKSKATMARERAMLEKLRLAGGDWLGYGDVVTDDDVKEYLDGFEPGTTIGRDPHWPDSDDMWVKEDDGSGWKIYASNAPEWGWAETPSRHLTNEEAFAEAGESLRATLARGKRQEQAIQFKDEVDAKVAAEIGEPEKLPNGGPGAAYVRQQREMLRIGKLLDKEVQKRVAEKTKTMPDMKYLRFKKETAEYELKQAADATKARSGPLVFDLMADEMMLQTGVSREEAEAAIGYGYWRHHEQGQMSKLVGGPFAGHPVTFAQWKVAWNEDLKAKTISYRDEKGFKRGIQESVLMNDGDQVSDYGVGNIFRLALRAHAGDYDLTEEEFAKIPWYGQDATKEKMLARFSPNAAVAVRYALLDKARARNKEAGDAYRAAEDTEPTALRDSVLEVLGEVREMGGGPRIEYASQVKKDARALTDEAYDYYPRDWQERLASGGYVGSTQTTTTLPLYVALTQVRGKFHSRNATDRKTGRAADQIWGSATYRKGLPGQGGKEAARFPVMVHELGHRFENYMPEIGAAEWTYWNYLARGRSDDMTLDAEVPQPIRKIRRSRGKDDGGYKSREVSIKDDMNEEYILKTYGGGNPYRDWELLTMGVEDLMTGGRRYIGEDAEYRQWILGLLATI